MWLIVTKVQSKSFGMATEHRHYNGWAGYRALSLKQMSCPKCLHNMSYSSLPSVVIAHFLCIALCAYSMFRHHPTPRLSLCQISFLWQPLLLSWPTVKNHILNHSFTHSLNQLIWCHGNRSFHFGITCRHATETKAATGIVLKSSECWFRSLTDGCVARPVCKPISKIYPQNVVVMIHEAATRFDVCVLCRRLTVPGTADKRCQLQPAMATFIPDWYWAVLCCACMKCLSKYVFVSVTRSGGSV